MTNPPKDETVRIRKMLQEFGSVGDANVFYWFQNRRSRLRRQQRHALHAHSIIMMSNMTVSMSDVDGSGGGNGIVDSTSAGGGSAGDHICSAAPDRLISLGASSSAPHPHPHPHPVGIINHQLSSSSTSPQMKETMEHSHEDALGFGLFYHDHASFMNSYQRAAGHVIVLINEFPTEVPSGPFDMKAMFGEDLMLIHHPSGLPLPCDSHGIIILQPGSETKLNASTADQKRSSICPSHKDK
ncbi:hypothetical protein Scep_003074 [Stephania cephalantha]|uniref:Homeobox domain-containing protein n=1 Tax=Stephania cephalantha TaxID=152367 RepID=A0AAP0KQS6_9MAGN